MMTDEPIVRLASVAFASSSSRETAAGARYVFLEDELLIALWWVVWQKRA